jgi:hypothetical protein
VFTFIVIIKWILFYSEAISSECSLSGDDSAVPLKEALLKIRNLWMNLRCAFNVTKKTKQPP